MPSHQHEKSTCRLVSMLTVKSDRRILNCGNLCHLFSKLTIIVSKLITLSETWLVGDLACRWLDLLASYLRLLCCYLRCCSFHHYWQLRLQFSIWNKLPVKIRNSLSFAIIVKRNTHTHPFNGPFSGTTRVSQYQKGKPIWILLKRQWGRSGFSWNICKSAPRSRQITTPAPHHLVFTGRMPFLPPNQQHQSTEGLLP